MAFLYGTELPADLYRVLFEIDTNSHVVVSKSFADITKFSESANESELLFMIGSIFHVIDIRKETQI